MCPQILNTIGLVAGIVGTILIFKWGISFQPQSYGLDLEDGNIVDTKWGKMTKGEANIRDEIEKFCARRLSKVGIALVGLGFLLQLWAVWVPITKESNKVPEPTTTSVTPPAFSGGAPAALVTHL